MSSFRCDAHHTQPVTEITDQFFELPSKPIDIGSPLWYTIYTGSIMEEVTEMQGQLRSIQIIDPARDISLDWRCGQEPQVTHLDMSNPNDPIHKAVDDDQIVTLAASLTHAAANVLKSSPLDQTDLALNVSSGTLSGGCWWLVLDAPTRIEFKPETLERISEEMDVKAGGL